MIIDASPESVFALQYAKLQTCWDKLEEAHDRYIESLMEEVADDSPEMKYMMLPS